MKENWMKKLSLSGAEGKEQISSVPLVRIHPNPYQPRKDFEVEKIQELAQSIKTYGLLQPIILATVENGDGYIIAAGERRYKACLWLGWREIPAIIREYQGSSMAAVALIENLQREDLNYIEEAEGYKRLQEEFNLTQEVLAQRLGKSQSAIANKMRLLKLPVEIREMVKAEKLSERHARALLQLPRDMQREAVEKIVSGNLNVKETEELVQDLLKQEESAEELPSQANRLRKKKTVIVKDHRIFLNTIRQAVRVIEKAGLNPHIVENENSECWEVTIKLPKKT